MPTLIEEFEAMHGIHEDFCKELASLISRILHARSLVVHSISSRKKEKQSFANKISKKGSAYQKISDVTDIIGIRIITYFADQVDLIAELIEKEFDIDVSNSIDKRASLDPDRFGYLSLHYVVSLPKSRLALTENRRFDGLKAEIQVRSILQHAWAEIEHDLGYKSNGEIPISVKRQFARLSGLLELGDKEFIDIREKLSSYTQSISVTSSEELQPALIDKITLLEFAKREPIVSEIDSAIATALACTIKNIEPDIDNDVDRLAYFKINTIADLHKSLMAHKDKIIALAETWSKDDDEELREDPQLPPATSIFYLCHILAGNTLDAEKVMEYFKKFHIGSPTEDEYTTAELLVKLAKQPMNASAKI